jgi:HEAT repeat protein
MDNTYQALIEELHHPDKNIRSQAAVNIGKLDDESWVDSLIQALITEPDMYVREDITWALVRMKETALQPLVDLLDDQNPSTRHHVTHVLTKIGGQEVVEPLIHSLPDTNGAVVSKAAFGLAQIGDERAIPELVNLLGHPQREVETMLMDVLERFGTAAVQPLIERMNDECWPVREQATDILGQIGDQAALPALIHALKDGVWQVRFAAVTALGHMGSAGAKTALQSLVDDPELHVRNLVVKVIRRIRA